MDLLINDILLGNRHTSGHKAEYYMQPFQLIYIVMKYWV